MGGVATVHGMVFQVSLGGKKAADVLMSFNVSLFFAKPLFQDHGDMLPRDTCARVCRQLFVIERIQFKSLGFRV